MDCRHPGPWSLTALCVAASCADDPGPVAEKPPGWHLYTQGEYAGAIERFRKNLDQDPKDTGTLFYLARSFTFLSRYDSARACIERALELYTAALERDPGLAAAHYRIARRYLEEGREVLAGIHLERFRALKESRP